jgi:hypothetical protein
MICLNCQQPVNGKFRGCLNALLPYCLGLQRPGLIGDLVPTSLSLFSTSAGLLCKLWPEARAGPAATPPSIIRSWKPQRTRANLPGAARDFFMFGRRNTSTPYISTFLSFAFSNF